MEKKDKTIYRTEAEGAVTVVGIDLGTTNTLISLYDETTGRASCIENSTGSCLTPSVIRFDEKKSENGTEYYYVVGKEARESADIYPDRTAMLFKRQMGRTRDFKKIYGTSYSPQMLSAMVLKSVLRDAEEELGAPVTHAVVTVPADFDDAGRKATLEAARAAGLEERNVDIIDEPAASLFDCERLLNLEGKTVLVFDLGGGTLDLMAAEITEDSINEAANRGDVHLGGSDWDYALGCHILNTYLKGKEFNMEDRQKFWLSVEQLKRNLSSLKEADMYVHTKAGEEKIHITREEFENVTQHLLKRVKSVLEDLMTDLYEKGIGSVDEVLLVGGAARMPQIRTLLAEFFPYSRMGSGDADRAVANGAAIYGWIKYNGQKPGSRNTDKLYEVRKMFTPRVLNRISSRSYGLAALIGDDGEEKIYHFILKGDGVPVSVTKELYTAYSNQRIVNIRIYETTLFERYVDPDEKWLLGTCTLSIDKDLPEHSPILIRFTIREDGRLQVEAKEKKGGNRIQVELESRALLNEEAVEREKRRLDKLVML